MLSIHENRNISELRRIFFASMLLMFWLRLSSHFNDYWECFNTTVQCICMHFAAVRTLDFLINKSTFILFQPQRRFHTYIDDNGGGGQKFPILRRHSLWTAHIPSSFIPASKFIRELRVSTYVRHHPINRILKWET